MEAWSAHALNALEQAGLHRGGARSAIVEHLGRQRCAVSAHEIEDGLRRDGRSVGRASIYRALEQLDRLKLVSRLDVGDGPLRYEPVAPGGEHHHHLVCDDCGRVQPFEDPALERAVAAVSERVPFAVAEHDIVLHGQCRECDSSAVG